MTNKDQPVTIAYLFDALGMDENTDLTAMSDGQKQSMAKATRNVFGDRAATKFRVAVGLDDNPVPSSVAVN
jgi:hypothetical protein